MNLLFASSCLCFRGKIHGNHFQHWESKLYFFPFVSPCLLSSVDLSWPESSTCLLEGKNRSVRQTERVAAQGGTGAPGAAPPLSQVFWLSLKGLCLEVTLGEEKPSSMCLGVKPEPLEEVTAITALLIYATWLSKIPTANGG